MIEDVRCRLEREVERMGERMGERAGRRSEMEEKGMDGGGLRSALMVVVDRCSWEWLKCSCGGGG